MRREFKTTKHFIMKLQSLKSEKFETITKEQMAFVTGGETEVATERGNIQITGHATLKDGRYEYSKDRKIWNDDGTWRGTEYYIKDTWY
ncbi:hypothetical protein D3C87_129960 [compost metagenome]